MEEALGMEMLSPAAGTNRRLSSTGDSYSGRGGAEGEMVASVASGDSRKG